MAYREALPEQHDERIQEFDDSIHTVVPADHFLQDEHQRSNQRSQLPLGLSPPPSPPPRPMTPPQIPLEQVVTCAGRVVNPPERYGFENTDIDATMRDAHPQSQIPEL